MKLSVLVLSLLLTTTVFASRYNLPQPKTWGANKVKVYFISPAVQLGKTTPEAVYLKSRAVLQWGTSVYESGTLVYKCKTGKARCQTYQFISQGSFEKCLVKNERIRCSNRYETSAVETETEERDHHLDDPRTWPDPERLENESDDVSPAFEEPARDHHLDDSSYSDVADDGHDPLF